MKTKRFLTRILLPLVFVFILLFNLTACSQDRFMKRSEYLRGLPANGLIPCTISLNVNCYGQYWQTFDLEFVLSYNDAPITVTNFVYLVQSGFYDYTRFDENAGKDEQDRVKPIMHRLDKSTNFFILQGGGYKVNSEKADDIVELRTGGLNYSIKGEFADNGWDNNTISHKAGVISMARQTGYDTASSEFFITFSDASEACDDKYAAFGYIPEGTKIDGDLLTALNATPTSSERFSFSSTYLNDYPKYQIQIVGITVTTSLTFPKPLQISK